MKLPFIKTSQHDHGARLDRADQYKQFIKNALTADQAMDAGEHYSSGDVHAWLERLSIDSKAERPKPDRQ